MVRLKEFALKSLSNCTRTILEIRMSEMIHMLSFSEFTQCLRFSETFGLNYKEQIFRQ